MHSGVPELFILVSRDLAQVCTHAVHRLVVASIVASRTLAGIKDEVVVDGVNVLHLETAAAITRRKVLLNDVNLVIRIRVRHEA